MRRNERITALYERLSRDDDQQGESSSISNQKSYLEDTATGNGHTNLRHFTDDGVSGSRFDRPGFMAMLEEVEAGNVDCIYVKDMSRVGRDYLKVGQVMELLRQKGVRLIAVNDGVDSFRGEDDFTPFRNIMKAKYVIHTVSLKYRPNDPKYAELLRDCYISSPDLARHMACTALLFWQSLNTRNVWRRL